MNVNTQPQHGTTCMTCGRRIRCGVTECRRCAQLLDMADRGSKTAVSALLRLHARCLEMVLDTTVPVQLAS